MLSTSNLKTFIAVVETASFTTAAVRLHATQSGVSQQIAKLEEQLDVQLIDRTVNGASPTPAGKRLYEKALMIIDLLVQAESEARAFRKGLEGSVHIGLMPALTRVIAGPVHRRVIKNHPNLAIQITEQVSTDLIQSVLKGDIEFAIVPMFEAPESIFCQPLRTTYEVLVQASKPGDHHGHPIDLRGLHPMRLVLQSPGSIRREKILNELRAYGIEVKEVISIDSMFGTFEFVNQTEFVAILPAIMMVPEAFNRRLCIRPISNPQIGLDLIAIENKTKRNPQVGSMLLREYVCEIDQAHCQLDSLWQSPRAT